MLGATGFGRWRANSTDTPVELRFVDMLLIIIASLMLVAVVLSITSAFTGSGRVDVAPLIRTGSAPAALAGEDYALRLAAEGGDGSFTWRLASGDLPDGLSLTADGTVEGVAARVQIAQVTIEVTDGQRRSDSRELVFEVRSSGDPAPEQVTLRVRSDVLLLPDGVGGTAYQYDFAGESGAPPYRWSVSDGAVPAGLELSGDGALVGRPERSGVSQFVVTITDSAGHAATQRAVLTVADPPTPLWRRILDWLRTGLTVLGGLMLLGYLLVYLFGAPAQAGLPPVWERRRIRKQR